MLTQEATMAAYAAIAPPLDGPAVRAACVARGVHVSTLARVAGLSYSHVYEILTGKRPCGRLSTDRIRAACDTLGIPCDVGECEVAKNA
jgi:transcriptional regulator with XRE-family HTH domain